MKRVLLLSGLLLFLFSCEKDDKTKPKTQTRNCRIIKTEIVEDGESRTEIHHYDSTNQLIKKCLRYNESYEACFEVIYSNNEVVYTFYDSTRNRLDTAFKGIYKNNQLKEYVDYTYNEPQYILLNYSASTNRLVELIDSTKSDKRVYDVKTDNYGNPTQLTLIHRTSNSVYDVAEIDITYSNYSNPERFDLSTQSWINLFSSKTPKNIRYTSAESHFTNLNYQITSKDGIYPSNLTLVIDEGIYRENRFSYQCD